MAFVYRHLCRGYPGRYHLIINRALYELLRLGNFGLDTLPNVHVLDGRAITDIKRYAHTNWLVNLGRLPSLISYHNQTAAILRSHGIESLQVFLEMVPVLGLLPISDVHMVASVVSHHPKYYSRRRIECNLLLLALRNYRRVDALYALIEQRLVALGVNVDKIRTPRRNCVNHDQFHPEHKEHIVSFSARAILMKNPLLMLETVRLVVEQAPDLRFYILGDGPLFRTLNHRVARLELERWVTVKHMHDPSPVINRSLIHLSLEQFDNTTNQSLLEGMAAGCAIVATDVGSTATVVTPEIGVLVDSNPSEIAAAILALVGDPKLARSMGEAARATVLRDHNVEQYMRHLDELHRFPPA